MFSIALLLLESVIWDSLTRAYKKNSYKSVFLFSASCIFSCCLFYVSPHIFLWLVECCWCILFLQPEEEECISEKVKLTVYSALSNHRFNKNKQKEIDAFLGGCFLQSKLRVFCWNLFVFILSKWSCFAECYAVSIHFPVVDQLWAMSDASEKSSGNTRMAIKD